VIAQDLFGLGDDLLPWLLLAFGGAMVAGNVMALVRPPKPPAGTLEEPPERPPVTRSVVMIVLGAVVAIWALASLIG
jgi:hypothetical protein